MPTARTGAPLPELVGFIRPRWREDVPALWRDTSTIQLGEDVVVGAVTRAHLEWMGRLDGLRTSDQVEAGVTLSIREARRMLRAMLAAGALEDAARIPESVRWAAQEDRDAAGRRFGAILRATGDLDTAYRTEAARDATRVLVRGTGEVADQVTATVEAAGLRPVARLPQAAIAVLADAPHPDVPAVCAEDLSDTPHVHLGVLGRRAVVGPLVVPGRTSCLRCAHLHRRDADPAWPLLAVQWAQAVAAMPCPPIDPVLVRVASAHAVLLVRSWVDHPDRPDEWADRALELTLPDARGSWRPRPAHALCGCRWPAV